VSLDGCAYDESGLTISEIIAAPGVFTDDVETEMTLNDIASKLPNKCAKVLRMRYDGYSNREIAKNQGIRVKDVDSLTEQIKDVFNNSKIYNAE